MTIVAIEGFEGYASRANLLSAGWLTVGQISGASDIVATGDTNPDAPDAGARTGTRCVRLSFESAGSGGRIRRNLPASSDTLHVAFAFNTESIPGSLRLPIMTVVGSDSGTGGVGWLQTNGNQSLSIVGNDGTILASSAAALINVQTWYHIEVRIQQSTGQCEVRLNGDTDPVISFTGTSSTFGSQPFSAIEFGTWSMSVNPGGYFIDDVVVGDGAGTYNSGWLGDARVAILRPNADTDQAGWGSYPAQLFGDGQYFPGSGGAYTAADASLDVGSGDFTLETWVKMDTLPPGSETADLISRYTTTGDQRTYRLYVSGDSDGHRLTFTSSTDGTFSTTEVVKVSNNFNPRRGQWYHVAVSRNSGVTRMFIDGKENGVGATDTRTYFGGGSSVLMLGARPSNSTGSSTENNSELNGLLDETRVTIGVGRYTANFTRPTGPFPRNTTDDPDFNSVQLLLSYDTDFTDDSPAGRSVIASSEGSPRVVTPRDAAGGVELIDDEVTADSNFISADFIAASNILTVTAQPAAGDTVVLGSVTYTFRTALAAANDILIGADIQASIANLTAAINATTGEGTTYGTGTVVNPDAFAEDLGDQQMKAVANNQGTAGNSIATTVTGTGYTWDGATLTGGTDIPPPSRFEYTNVVPTATAVLAVAVQNRFSKTDATTATVTTEVQVGASSTLISTDTVSTTPTYYTTIVEEDPATSAQWSINGVNNIEMRVNRTV